MSRVTYYTGVPDKKGKERGMAPRGGLKEVVGANIKIRPVYRLSSRDQLVRSPFEVRRRINAYFKFAQKEGDVVSLYGLANALNCSIELLKNIENAPQVDEKVADVVRIGRNRVFEWMEKSGYKLTNPTFTMFALEALAGWSKKTEHKQLNVNVDLLALLDRSTRTGDSAPRTNTIEGKFAEAASVVDAIPSPRK